MTSKGFFYFLVGIILLFSLISTTQAVNVLELSMSEKVTGQEPPTLFNILINKILDFFNGPSPITGKAISGSGDVPLTGVWWNTTWHYRVGHEFDAETYNRTDWPVEFTVNFTDELSSLGVSSDFDQNSIRIIEYNTSGYIEQELSYSFEPDNDYDSSDNAVGLITFILNGTMQPSSVRDFHVYFDTVDNPKSSKIYSSLISYNWDGEEFSMENDLIDLTVDTLRSEGASGLYYAQRKDSGKVIFDTPTNERPTEYIEYYDGSNYYSFDLRNDATLILDSGVKKVISQTGDEVLWNTQTSTGNKMTKIYTIYEKSPWIKIEQIFQNPTNSSVTRRSDGIKALTLDVERAYGLDNLIGPGGAGADPYSWKSATKISTASGLGVINYEEIGTTNYFAQGSVFTGLAGIQLGSTTINADENISNTAIVYFNDEDNSDIIQDLKNRIQTPVTVSQLPSEEYRVELNISTDHNIYNLNETISISTNVTQDTHNNVQYINVTLDKGTGTTLDDTTIILYDDGAHNDGVSDDGLFSNVYTIDENEDIGEWDLTADSYDKYLQPTYQTSMNINVTNVLYSKLFIKNPTGLVSRSVESIFNLINFRNDTYIKNAQLTCDYNGTSVTQISSLGNGNYSVNFTAPVIIGVYTLTCSGIEANNLAQDSELFYAEPEKTTIDLNFTPLTKTITGITQTAKNNFTFDISMKNTGQGIASATNLSLTIPNNNFTINSSFEQCGNLAVGENCTASFFVETLSKTPAKDYNLSLNAIWINPDLVITNSLKNLVITVASNPIFSLSDSILNASVVEGTNMSHSNFTINSIGNDDVLDLNFNCSSGLACNDFNLTFLPSNIANIPGGLSNDVEIFISVPEGYDPGNYSGIVDVSSTNALDSNFTINVLVPESGTWQISPLSCGSIVLIEDAGDICLISLNNTGNIQLNFSSNPLGSNYSFIDPSNFTIQKQQNGSFYVRYNTSGSPQGNFNSEYTISATPFANPLSENLNVSLSVVFGPEVKVIIPTESEQAGILPIQANISDRSISGIDWVRANITKPDNSVEVVNLTNLTQMGIGGYSLWGIDYTNTRERGIYKITIFSNDIAGGFGSSNDSLMIYATLNSSVNSGWQDYLLGESGSLYYTVTDGAGDPLVADVNISIRDPDQNTRFKEDYKTNTFGKLEVIPSFSIPSDSIIGNYTIDSAVTYDDTISGKTISSSDNSTFSVYDHLFISLDTSVTWYPDSVMVFYILVYTTGDMNNLPTAIDLEVYDPAQAIYTTATLADLTVVDQTNSSILYNYKYAMPANSPTGDFLARVDVAQGTRSFQDVQSFRVSSGGPFDLILILNQSEAQRGKDVTFDVLMKNMGEVSQDVYLDYWVSDASGNNYSKVFGEAIYVGAADNTTISRSLPIFITQPLGEHFVSVTMDYSQVIGPITTSKNFFVIEAVDNETNETEPPVVPPTEGGSGGGGEAGAPISKPEEPKLIVLDIDPDELDIEKEGTSYIMIELKNTWGNNLTNLEAELTLNGIPLSQPSQLSLLPFGQKIILPLKIKIPDTQKTGFYEGTLTITSKETQIEQPYTINIFDSKDDLLANRQSRLKNKLETLRTRTIQAESDNLEVNEILNSIQNIYLDFDLVSDTLQQKKYLATIEHLDSIEDQIEETDYLLSAIISQQSPPYLLYALVIAILIILIIIVIYFLTKIRRSRVRSNFTLLKKKYNIPSHPHTKPAKKNRPSIKTQVIKKLKKASKTRESKTKDFYEERARHLKTLEEQYKHGGLSKKAYDELRGRV